MHKIWRFIVFALNLSKFCFENYSRLLLLAVHYVPMTKYDRCLRTRQNLSKSLIWGKFCQDCMVRKSAVRVNFRSMTKMFWGIRVQNTNFVQFHISVEQEIHKCHTKIWYSTAWKSTEMRVEVVKLVTTQTSEEQYKRWGGRTVGGFAIFSERWGEVDGCSAERRPLRAIGWSWSRQVLWLSQVTRSELLGTFNNPTHTHTHNWSFEISAIRCSHPYTQSSRKYAPRTSSGFLIWI